MPSQGSDSSDDDYCPQLPPGLPVAPPAPVSYQAAEPEEGESICSYQNLCSIISRHNYKYSIGVHFTLKVVSFLHVRAHYFILYTHSQFN